MSKDFEAPPAPPPPTPTPRPFSQATGFVYQAVGFLMAMSTCCWWSFAGLTQEEVRPTEPGRQIVDIAQDAAPPLRWAMAAVCLLFAGGLGLVALGMGLQSDRLQSGRAPKWTTGAAALFFLSYLGMSIFAWTPSGARISTVAILAAVWIVLFLLAGVSAEELRKYPPTPRSNSWTARDEDDLRKALSPRPRDKTNP